MKKSAAIAIVFAIIVFGYELAGIAAEIGAILGVITSDLFFKDFLKVVFLWLFAMILGGLFHMVLVYTFEGFCSLFSKTYH